MRYIVYHVRAIEDGFTLQESFPSLEHAQEWCKENNQELAKVNRTERWEPIKTILWWKAFSEFTNVAITVAFISCWVRGDLKQALFVVLLRLMLFGVPVVTLKQL